MYYYGFRYYAAWLCRFVSVDPLAGKFPFYTPFQYTGNNPVTFTDLDGKETTGNEKTGVDTNGQQNNQESSNATWEFTKGTGRGLWTGLKGTWNFITDDAWKAETWIGTGNLILGLALTQHNPAGVTTLMEVDEKLGTNTFGAVSGMHQAIDQGVDKFSNGDWGDKGEIFGSTLYAIGESVIGSKGAGVVTKSKFGTNLISKFKNGKRLNAKVGMPSWIIEGIKFENKYFSDLIKSGKKFNGGFHLKL